MCRQILSTLLNKTVSFFVQSFYSRRNYLHWFSLVSLTRSFISFLNFHILTSISLGGWQCSPKWIRLIICKSLLIPALQFSYHRYYTPIWWKFGHDYFHYKYNCKNYLRTSLLCMGNFHSKQNIGWWKHWQGLHPF